MASILPLPRHGLMRYMQHACPLRPSAHPITISLRLRPLSLSAPLLKVRNPQNPPLPPILDTDITENFLKGSGPGGQKINKTSSAVQLQHHPTGIVVKCQATRSRSQNRTIARRLLAERIEMLEKGEESRVERKRETARRKKASREKKSKRKYRALAEEKAAGSQDEGDEEEDDEGGGEEGAVEGRKVEAMNEASDQSINEARNRAPSPSANPLPP